MYDRPAAGGKRLLVPRFEALTNFTFSDDGGCVEEPRRTGVRFACFGKLGIERTLASFAVTAYCVPEFLLRRVPQKTRRVPGRYFIPGLSRDPSLSSEWDQYVFRRRMEVDSCTPNLAIAGDACCTATRSTGSKLVRCGARRATSHQSVFIQKDPHASFGKHVLTADAWR